MKIKIFQGAGFDDIRDLEDEINNWLANEIKVENVTTSMCQVAEFPDEGERIQHFVATIWYEEA